VSVGCLRVVEKLIEICDELIWKGAITKNAVMEKVTGSEEGRIIFLQLQTRIGRYKDVWKVITDRLQTIRLQIHKTENYTQKNNTENIQIYSIWL
jgi:hypothetical protein